MGRLDTTGNQRTRARLATLAASAALPLSGVAHQWDFNHGTTTTSFVKDLIGTCDMTATGGTATLSTSQLGSKGLQSARMAPAGAATLRMLGSALTLTSQPFWASWVGRAPASPTAAVWFEIGSRPPNRCHAFQDGNHNAYGGTSYISATSSNSQTPHVHYVEYNGASSKYYLDGSLIVSGSPGTVASNSNLCFFNLYAGGVGGDAIMGEVLMGTGTNTGTDITAESTRLTNKWI